MKAYLILLLILLFVSGCKTYEPPTTISMYGTDMYFSPKVPEAVQVFHNKPPGRYMEIGELTVEKAYSLNRAKDVLRRKAAGLGGDAVYIVDILVVPDTYPYSYGFQYGHHHHPYGFNYGYNRYADYEYTVTGVVIRYNR